MKLPTIEENGYLPAYAWPGGYPIIYLDGENSVLCHVCATKSFADEIEKFRPIAADIHWEGPPLFCDQCSVEIPSAYGNPDAEVK